MRFGMVRVTFVPLRGPSGLLALRMRRHDERTVRHVAHDRGTRRDVNVVAELDRRNQLRVASDHAAVADSRLMLVVAIVVDRDNATSDVGLDEISDAVMTFEFSAGAQIREWPDVAFLADYAFLRAHAELQMTPVADDDIAQPRGALDCHPSADSAPPHDLHVRADHRIAPDFDLFADIGGRRIDQGYSRRHQPAINFVTNLSFHLGQLLARIYPGKLGRISRLPCFDGDAALPRDCDDISEIVLALRIVGTQLGERLPQ